MVWVWVWELVMVLGLVVGYKREYILVLEWVMEWELVLAVNKYFVLLL